MSTSSGRKTDKIPIPQRLPAVEEKRVRFPYLNIYQQWKKTGKIPLPQHLPVVEEKRVRKDGQFKLPESHFQTVKQVLHFQLNLKII